MHLCLCEKVISDQRCPHAQQSPSYLDEVLQPLFDLSYCGVHAANFDLWILPLSMQTISNNSACITGRKKTKKRSQISYLAKQQPHLLMCDYL